MKTVMIPRPETADELECVAQAFSDRHERVIVMVQLIAEGEGETRIVTYGVDGEDVRAVLLGAAREVAQALV